MGFRNINDAEQIANPRRSRYLRTPRADDKGPWFPARYGGECDTCGDPFYEHDEIRADGKSGWEARECCGDDE